MEISCDGEYARLREHGAAERHIAHPRFASASRAHFWRGDHISVWAAGRRARGLGS